MPERLYQFRFNEEGKLAAPQNVTPKEFAGLAIPGNRKLDVLPRLSEAGRLIREVKESVQVIAPTIAGQYLLEQVFTPFEQFDQEETWVLLLNTKHWITHEVMVYRGTLNSAIIRPAEIFKPAVRVNAQVIIMAHNHPSGDPTPSPEDEQVTRQLEQVGQYLDTELLDHIVVGKDCWVSLRDKGLGFESERVDWRGQKYATIT
jgi:DNA repair protein RadC